MISAEALRHSRAAGEGAIAPAGLAGRGLRWSEVARLGLAQIAIGAVAALMMSTLNRIMVVELGLPATVPSALVALHFAGLAPMRHG